MIAKLNDRYKNIFKIGYYYSGTPYRDIIYWLNAPIADGGYELGYTLSGKTFLLKYAGERRVINLLQNVYEYYIESGDTELVASEKVAKDMATEIYNMYKEKWERIKLALESQYNPIENYNRTELETIDDNQTDTINGSKVNVASGSDSLTGNQSNSGTDTNVNSQTAYDSNSLKVHDDSKLTYGHRVDDSSTTTYGRHDTLTDVEEQKRIGKITRNNHTSGNIGITTSQDMLSQEAEIAVLVNILPTICQSFKERFCLLVY